MPLFKHGLISYDAVDKDLVNVFQAFCLSRGQQSPAEPTGIRIELLQA